VARKLHYLDAIVQSMREELETMADGVKSTFRDSVPLGHKPISKRQQLARFLGMSPEMRLQLFNEVGPEAYSDFVMERVDDLQSVVGPAAQNLMPYFFSGVPTDAVGEVTAEEVHVDGG
jgi:hypothetical protein